MRGPSLSEVRAWTPDYLIDAASHWRRTAQSWSDAFDHVVEQTGGTEWSGDGADAASRRVGDDRRRVVGAVDGLHASASGARAAADGLARARLRLLGRVSRAEGAGFVVGEDYSVSCGGWSLSPRLAMMRRAEAAVLTAELRADAAALAALDFDAAEAIKAAVADLRELSFDEVEISEFGPLKPMPEDPILPPPPGGWDKNPITRAAQKIVAHAWTAHHSDWPEGTTREQITADVERMLRTANDPKSGLQVGLGKDGGPVIYDPKTHIWIWRDPNAAYGGSVVKLTPEDGETKVRTSMPTRYRYLSPEKLGFPPEAFEPPKQPPRLPRGGPPVSLPPPQIVPAPRNGPGLPPALDSDGVPDPGIPMPGDT